VRAHAEGQAVPGRDAARPPDPRARRQRRRDRRGGHYSLSHVGVAVTEGAAAPRIQDAFGRHCHRGIQPGRYGNNPVALEAVLRDARRHEARAHAPVAQRAIQPRSARPHRAAVREHDRVIKGTGGHEHRRPRKCRPPRSPSRRRRCRHAPQCADYGLRVVYIYIYI